MPSYKPKGYLWQCLDSLCNQSLSYNNYEIIIVLNGCNEPYKTHIIEYARRQDAQLIIRQTDVGGVSNARNIGIDIARGDYITFVDDDDYVSERYLEDLLSAASPHQISIARPLAFYDETGNVWDKYPIALLFEKYQGKHNISFRKVRKFFSGPVLKLYPQSIVDERRFNTKFKVGEDVLFNYLISDKINRVSFAPKQAVYYRRLRKGSVLLSYRNTGEKVLNNWRLFKMMARIYLSNPFKYSLSYLLRTGIGLCWSAINKLN